MKAPLEITQNPGNIAANRFPAYVDLVRRQLARDYPADALAGAGLSVREAIRQNGTPYLDLGLDDPGLGDEALLDAMLRTPILINRPFVQTDQGIRLCRPSEVVLDLLPPLTAPFVKEDGEVVIDSHGRRVR
ncbi:ArsC/Spx/MgsR family protein [Lysobacter sp. 2RAB21]